MGQNPGKFWLALNTPDNPLDCRLNSLDNYLATIYKLILAKNE
jgi:hypothetical protein